MLNRWVTVGLAALATLALAGLSMADVPNEANSTVDCYCTTDDSTSEGSGRDEFWECTISPAGAENTEDIFVDVVVRNHLNQPLAGTTVTVTPTTLNGEVDVWDDGLAPPGDLDEDPQVALSNALGVADFLFDEGSIEQATPTTFPNMDFNVLMTGPGPGAAVKWCPYQFEVVGYDHNLSRKVDIIDLALFAAEGWPLQDLEYDYNHDESVGIIDLAKFAAVWGHENLLNR